jgi:hypothetical protein
VDTGTIVALVSSGLAAIIAVAVPWMTFRLTLRLDHTRWLREQRAQLYVDLLTEAYAEQQYFEYDMADDETRARMGRHFTDLRLPPLERARLGARAGSIVEELQAALRREIGADRLPLTPGESRPTPQDPGR